MQIANGIGSPTPVLDNVTVVVPEPSTWALVVLGVEVVAYPMRRTRRSA